MLTFLHAADFHLDSPFHALPRNRRRNAGRSSASCSPAWRTPPARHRLTWSFWRGTFFDGQRARPDTVQALCQVLEELEAEVFLSPATTTPYSPTSPLRKVSLAGPRTYLHPGRPGPGGGAPVGGGGLRQCLYLPLPDGQPPWPGLPRPGGGPGRFRLLSWGPLLRPQPLRPHHPQ